MTLPGLDGLAYLIIGPILAAAIGLILWLRSQVSRSNRTLAQARLELEGANNRLVQFKDQAALLSRTDPVTGLLVRHVVVERFQFALALARRQDTVFGIVLIQLTNCEQLAGQHGAGIGDKLLSALSTRLLAVTREVDTVGRVRDYEFAVLLPSLRNASNLDQIVSKLRTAFDAPFAVPGLAQAVHLTANFGSASYPQDGASWATMLKAADESLRLSRMQVRA